ncbi:MAG: GGDEF domain-containing protein [Acidobacteriaceae bacterium]|nr:GGDEF domain-containing protein [Acidobacteriaceae bacterium]
MNRTSLKACFFPGAAVLLVAAALESGVVPISTQAVDLYYYAAFGVGLLIAWRFHSSRVIFVLLTLILGHHAIEFFSPTHRLANGPGRIAFEAVSLLIPIDFIVFSVTRERGFAVPSLVPRALLLFLEAVFVAVICRPGEITAPPFLRANILGSSNSSWSRIPQFALFAFVVAFAVLVTRFILYRRPVEHGLMWSLPAAFLGLQAGAISRNGEFYFATAGLILLASLLENSYFLAYHDELTSLPARRAFNDALLSLETPFAIAVVDIDHFKNVNDTYGHETGDQVLSMVASRLARIDSGGKAYRVGGEEFTILFPGKTVKEIVTELEALRISISESSFRLRNTPERRKASRGPDRRQVMNERHAKRAQRVGVSISGQLSVTVSIGVAEPNSPRQSAEEVIQSADKALYRAKRSGRNRVELAKLPRPILARRAASR